MRKGEKEQMYTQCDRVQHDLFLQLLWTIGQMDWFFYKTEQNKK